jgi:2-methylcitrate dehydratase PrpD
MARQDDGRVTRRRLLKGAGGLIAAVGTPSPSASASQAQTAPPPGRPTDVTARLARYMVEARDRALPTEAAREARHRILDTVAAIVSGSHLPPGEAAIRFIQTQGGKEEASVLTTSIRTSAINAALANAMFAHADETDDFEPVTKAHPGCAVVPAAFAIGEREGRSGAEVLRAVALGYDLCCRFLMALGPDHVPA